MKFQIFKYKFCNWKFNWLFTKSISIDYENSNKFEELPKFSFSSIKETLLSFCHFLMIDTIEHTQVMGKEKAYGSHNEP
jgi:hypothetical protein